MTEVIDMNNAVKEKKEVVVAYEVGGNQIKLTPSIVQQYIVGNDSPITMQEFKFFTELCKARGLNPFLKEVYCIKYGNQPAQIVVGKDAIIKRAVLNPEFDGIESGVIVISDNSITERKGCFVAPNETLVGGWAKVYRKNWSYPTYCSVGLEESASRKKDGSLNSMWASKPATMIEKVAKVRALREAFVENLAGLYDEDEIQKNDIMDIVEEQPNIIEQEEPQEVIEQAMSSDVVNQPQQIGFDDL